MKPKNIPGVPKQVKGSYHDSESRKEVKNSADLDLTFTILRKRFLAINQWKDYCKESNTDFRLCDSAGKYVERLPQIGDYIRIDIPGFGGAEGRSFDWVQIILIDLENRDMIMIRCRPSTDPVKENNNKIAHFYSNSSTSTFIISKDKNSVKVGIYGRNEYPNLNAGFSNSLRNILIAFGGMFGFSKIQWKCLANGLLDFE